MVDGGERQGKWGVSGNLMRNGGKSAKFRYHVSIRNTMCLYFMHLCVHSRELLFLLLAIIMQNMVNQLVTKKIFFKWGNPRKRVGGGRRPNGASQIGGN